MSGTRVPELSYSRDSSHSTGIFGLPRFYESDYLKYCPDGTVESFIQRHRGVFLSASVEGYYYRGDPAGCRPEAHTTRPVASEIPRLKRGNSGFAHLGCERCMNLTVYECTSKLRDPQKDIWSAAATSAQASCQCAASPRCLTTSNNVGRCEQAQI